MSGQMTLASMLAAPAPVPAETRARARLHVLDWAGCAVAGAATAAGGRLWRALRHDPALGLGALGNLLEMDDVDRRARLHPGPVIVPAALVAARDAGASGDAVLDAIARGYAAMTRLGRAMGDAHYARFHPTATCGTVGAAVAVAAVIGLDAERTTAAITLAATRTGGVWETRNDSGSDAKQWHTATAVADGIRAALAARAGLRGPARVFEGAEGVFAGMAPDVEPAALAAPFDLMEISFKPWPACRHVHPVIDACLTLREERVTAAAVRGMRVGTYGDAIRFCDRAEPTTPGEARFSLQHAAAVTLSRGAPWMDAFEMDAVGAADVVALRGVVSVETDDRIAAAYPGHFGARVTVTLGDGAERTTRVADAWGDPEHPMSEADIVRKAERLCLWAGGSAAATARLLDAVMGIGRGGPAALLDTLAGLLP